MAGALTSGPPPPQRPPFTLALCRTLTSPTHSLHLDWLHAGRFTGAENLTRLRIGASSASELPDLGARPLLSLLLEETAIAALPPLPATLTSLSAPRNRLTHVDSLPDGLRVWMRRGKERERGEGSSHVGTERGPICECLPVASLVCG